MSHLKKIEKGCGWEGTNLRYKPTRPLSTNHGEFAFPLVRSRCAYLFLCRDNIKSPNWYRDECLMDEKRHALQRERLARNKKRESELNNRIINFLRGKSGRNAASKKEKRKKRHVSLEKERRSYYSPQSGVENIRFRRQIESLLKFAKVDHTEYTDEVLAHIEGVVALLLTLEGCTNYVAMSSAVFLYLRKFMDKSVTHYMMDYISTVFEFQPQSGECDKKVTSVDMFDSKNWVELVGNLRENWTLVRNNKLFSHFSKLLGLLVVAELCSVSDVTFSIKNYRLVEPDLEIIHGNAVDIFDAALTTVVFFVETLSLCWQSKSLTPLLFNATVATEMDEEYATLTMWWELVRNGNLFRVAGVSDQEFDKRLETLTTKIRNLLPTFRGFEKKVMEDKFQKLLQVKSDYTILKVSCGVRKAPFCLEFFGQSSQGKTTFCEQMIHAMLVSAGLPTDKEYQAAFNPDDKFNSTWKSNMLVMLFDDYCNTKADHIERPPTKTIIDVANNAPNVVNKADLREKGNVHMEPEILAVTTNVKDLAAGTFSNCPYSIQRRMNYVLTIYAKKEFQRTHEGFAQGIDPEKVAAYADANPNLVFDDIWEVDIEVAVKPSKLSSVAKYEFVEWNGKKMSAVSFAVATQFIIEKFNSHRTFQEALVQRMRNRKQIEICGVGGCRQIKGMCHVHTIENQQALCDKYEPHWGEEIVESLQSAFSTVKNRIVRDIFGFDRAIEGACAMTILYGAKQFAKHWDWMYLVPTPWLRNTGFQKFAMVATAPRLKRSYIFRSTVLWSSIFGAGCCARGMGRRESAVIYSSLILTGITVQKSMVHIVKKKFKKELVKRNTIAPMLQNVRDTHVSNLCKACAVVGTLYGLSKVYKAWRSMSPQGSLEPKTPEDVKRRDDETNVWTSVVQRQLPTTADTATTTSDQLIGLVEKNLVYGTVYLSNGRKLRVNGLFLTSNLVVIPDHYFEETVLSVDFIKCNPNACGGRFTVKLSLAQSIQLPHSDMRVCYASSGGSFKDIRKFLCRDKFGPVEFALRWRDKEGVLEKANGIAELKPVNNGVCDFLGWDYKSLTINTFQGMCGAPLVAKRKPILMGMHLGGRANSARGCAGYLNRYDVDEAVIKLRQIDGVIISGSAEKFEKQVLGVDVLTGSSAHRKSPVNYMPENSQIEFYGTCPGMSVFRSHVKVTPISEHVTDVTGEPNIYGPPIVNPQYMGWQMCLANIANPAHPFDPRLLMCAIRDYKSGLIPIFQSKLWRDACPLDDHENLCGIPGMKFMDAIKLDTSVGYPLGGCKRRFVIELPLTEDKPNNRVFDSVITDEINRCLECYKQGQRAYVIAKACKKDEILSKAKCRIFYGNGIALTFLVRKYFLKLTRVLQFNPKYSECAVGVNCHGPEWQELHDHIFHFGEDRLIGGDYGKYDQKLPSQLIFAALRIMIDFARECDYSEEDIRVMEAMTGDIVFAVIAFNGDLLGLTEGTHISGNSLTVIINGICGSLNMRCYFYKDRLLTAEGELPPFRDYVKLITYGDDNIGSVHPDCDDFTIKGASEFLAEYGQTYTMPDKESELTKFLPVEEFEFLKRKSVFIPEIGLRVGALIDRSCFKMLHCFLRDKESPLTEEHASAVNIDTAMREWFNHGRDVYEMRREQMQDVARRASILHLCETLDKTFDDCVNDWKFKYDPTWEPVASQAQEEREVYSQL